MMSMSMSIGIDEKDRKLEPEYAVLTKHNPPSDE